MQIKSAASGFFFPERFRSFRFCISALLLSVHSGLSLGGFHCFRMDNYMQIVQTLFPEGVPFGEMLFYFHGNPPLLSVLHQAGISLFGDSSFLFFDGLLPVLHVGSFLLFSSALRQPGWQVPRFWIAVLFLNPAVILYFRYPFYTGFLFFFNCLLCFLLARLPQRHSLLYAVAALFCVESLLRAPYSPFLLLGLIGFLAWKFPVRKPVFLGLLLIPFFAWPLKNYFLVGRFTSGSWSGMNLARGHLPWHIHDHPVEFIPTFSLPDQYFELLHDDPRIGRFLHEKNYYLSQNNLNHRVIPEVSDLYKESVIRNFSWSWSANTVLNGLLILFKSPANYQHLKEHVKADWHWKWEGWNPDFWDPVGLKDQEYNYLFFADAAWDPEGNRWNALKRITLYSLVYLTVLVFFGFRWAWLSVPEKVLYILMLYFTLLYASVDVLEANRMRMEYEAFFYYFVLRFFFKKENPSGRVPD